MSPYSYMLLLVLLASQEMPKHNCKIILGFQEDPIVAGVHGSEMGYGTGNLLRLVFCMDLGEKWYPVDLPWIDCHSKKRNPEIEGIAGKIFWPPKGQTIRPQEGAIRLVSKPCWDGPNQENIFFFIKKHGNPGKVDFQKRTISDKIFSDSGWADRPIPFMSRPEYRFESKTSRELCEGRSHKARAVLPQLVVDKDGKHGKKVIVRNSDYKLKRCLRTESGYILLMFNIPKVESTLVTSGEEHMFAGEHCVVIGSNKPVYVGNEAIFLGELNFAENKRPVLLFWRSVYLDNSGYYMVMPDDSSIIKKVWHGH